MLDPKKIIYTQKESDPNSRIQMEMRDKNRIENFVEEVIHVVLSLG